MLIDSNELTGSIPTEVGLLVSSLIIMIDNNAMADSIPTEVGFLTNLTELYLSKHFISIFL